jgi:hypothetical protein
MRINFYSDVTENTKNETDLPLGEFILNLVNNLDKNCAFCKRKRYQHILNYYNKQGKLKITVKQNPNMLSSSSKKKQQIPGKHIFSIYFSFRNQNVWIL